jgi:hypothetical protein
MSSSRNWKQHQILAFHYFVANGADQFATTLPQVVHLQAVQQVDLGEQQQQMGERHGNGGHLKIK